MRRCLLLVVCLFAVVSPALASGTSINVKDYGAKGDGNTDDTAAIQEAARAACAEQRPFWNDLSSAAHPEMVFPPGTYVISKPIFFSSPTFMPLHTLVRGIGKVRIRQTDPSADVFYFHFAYRVHIRNLGFESGKRSLKLWTNNMDTTVMSIEDCSFADSSSYAIECISRRSAEMKQVDHYDIDKDGLSYVEGGDAPYYYNSTVLHINRCKFSKCMRILHTNTDGGFIENCEMETHPDMTGAAIRNGGEIPNVFGGSGVMKLENVKCLFHVREGKDQHWIENHNFGLTLRNVQLTTDSPNGVCPVYNYARHRTGFSTQAYVIVEDSRFAAAGSRENAIVYCPEVPNLISIRNCASSNGEVSALGFPETPGPEYFKMYSHCREPMPAEGLGYTISGNSGITNNLPPSMLRFWRRPLATDVDAMIGQWSGDRDTFLSERAFKAGRIISASDYGVKGDGKTDDTEAIRKAVAAARTADSELQFPGAIYKISGMIDLPPSVTIRGMGRAVFWAVRPGQGGFRVKAARAVAFHNCSFESLATAATITVDGRPDDPAKILFRNCIFNHTRGTAVQCIAGAQNTDGSGLARLRVMESLFQSCRKNLVSNVSAIVDSSWISTLYVKKTDPYRDFAMFDNYGFLRCENTVGVPLVDAPARNIRWIDNFGRLICTSVRFGGEFGGACAVNIRRTPGIPKNIAVIQSSWLYDQNTNGREALVYCEAIPDLLVLRTNVGVEDPRWLPFSQLATVRIQAADKASEHRVYLDPFRISKYEVTVAQYRRFCQETGRSMPDAPKPWNTDDRQAMINVTWNDAAAYARWAGGRLPTEAEWEKAARGTDGRLYPWGNEWDRDKCRQYDGGVQEVAKVGSYPEDLSPFGCYDMGGNVCEWCSDWYSADYYGISLKSNPTGPSTGKYRVIRGGGWSNLAVRGGIRCASRKLAEPGYKWLDIGFRVVWPGTSN